MLGWINDCLEKLVLETFGVEVWHAVKAKAGCEVKDGGFLKLEHYSDKSTTDLVDAASELSGLTVPQVYEAFGVFFVPYVIDEGYENLLCCQGSTLKDWMTNINAIHQHLQTTFPKKMIMPEFWCEENGDGTLSLFYFSSRGNYLSPVASGLVTEVAKRQFGLSIVMTQETSQGVNGAKFTRYVTNSVLFAVSKPAQSLTQSPISLFCFVLFCFC
jgi:guanylate cyclase soluble subunit beta